MSCTVHDRVCLEIENHVIVLLSLHLSEMPGELRMVKKIPSVEMLPLMNQRTHLSVFCGLSI